MRTLNVKIEGIAPLIMHSVRTANPLDPITKKMKEISGKRSKTEADFTSLARLEWKAGLYVNADNRIIVPDINVERTIWEGAKQDKNGKKFLSSFMVTQSPMLQYTGPNDPEKLIEDGNFWFTVPVVVNRNRVMRTRPIFNDWSLEFECHYNESVLNQSEIETAIRKAGELVGLCDWRPKFGRFMVKDID